MDRISSQKVAREIIKTIERLYPICRSITGLGVRQTLEILQEQIPLEVREVPSGTPVFDWTVPREWHIRDAWIKDSKGERVVDFRRSNLHVVSYSTPVRRKVPREELMKHLHALPEHPDWIPYRTSYYLEDWGFCLTQKQRDALTEPAYDVCIDSSLEPGSLTYGECFLGGAMEDEVLISAHVCHPSLCNDNLTGVVLSVFLAKAMAERERRYSYRFLYIPGTIGAITWLAVNRERADRIKNGLTLVCLGDASKLTYKRSLAGAAEVDVAAQHVLKHSGQEHQVIDFFPYGYDERQYNSPGFRLAVGSLMRGRHGKFPEYHTSADNLDFISAEQIAGSYEVLSSILDVLEGNRRYRNLAPFCEPQLGKRGIYRNVERAPADLQLATLWVLSLSDGGHSLLDIAERSGMAFAAIRQAADLLVQHNLLEESR